MPGTRASRMIAVETHNPSLIMDQADVLQQVLKHHKVSPRGRILYERFFNDHGIRTRHFGFDDVRQVFEESYDEAVERFQKVAVDCGSRAAEKALLKSEVSPGQVAGLIVTTCTGYLCPGLATYMAERLGLRSDVFLLDLVGQGCAAAAPALRAADHCLKSRPQSFVLVVCVEVCSAAFSSGEAVDLLISNAIFGDGAAAVLVTDDPKLSGLELRHFESILCPEYRDDLRFKTKNSRLCNVISKRVPDLAGKTIMQLKQKIPGDFGEPQHYAFHTGGRAVLDAIQNELGLSDVQMNPSRDILRDYGNMSSPSILFVLKHLWESGDLKFDDRIFAFTFGAGFSAHGFSLICKTAETGLKPVSAGFCHEKI